MSRLLNDGEKFQEIVKLVQGYAEASGEEIAAFLDGGDEGWDCGDNEQFEWLRSESPEKISDWVIAGLR